MGRDEQREEREVLNSIFPDEITDVSDTEYRIAITLDIPGDDETAAEPPVLLLRVQYPEAYPDEPPSLDISTPPNAPRHNDFDVQEDKAGLLKSLQPSIDENMGMAMVFTLVSTLKDSAELLVSKRQQATQALREVAAAQKEEEENRKFHGTAVTRESFLEWRAKFKKEMQDEEQRMQDEKEVEDKKKRVVKEEKRLTGRELWERGMVGQLEEDDEDEDVIDSVQKLNLES